MVSGKFEVPEQTIMFMPFRCLRAVSAIFLRSATENEGYSPVEPRTTMPSAPFSLKKAIMSRYKPSSNFKFLSQGVAAAIQKRHFSVDACAEAGFAVAPAGIPTALRAATAPRLSKNVLRVVSIFTLFISIQHLQITRSPDHGDHPILTRSFSTCSTDMSAPSCQAVSGETWSPIT